jgi:hypothetical protein
MRLLFLLMAWRAFAQDPREIIAKALARDEKNYELLNTYTYEKLAIIKSLEKDGDVKKTEERLEEVIHIDGTEIERLVAKNGKPLSEKEAAAEQRKVDKEIEKIKKESPKERAKRRGETEKDLQEEREARREVLEAFDFRLLGVAVHNGRDCWQIEGKPKPGWKGKGRRASQMRSLEGRLWVDQQTFEWVRMELDSLDTISFGWFLFRLQQGAKIRIEQAYINNEVWLPTQVEIRADARVLGKMLRVDLTQQYRNFRKFSTDSTLIVGEPVEK